MLPFKELVTPLYLVATIGAGLGNGRRNSEGVGSSEPFAFKNDGSANVVALIRCGADETAL
jgi:hypothetical protein